jgi:hypothetical protein
VRFLRRFLIRLSNFVTRRSTDQREIAVGWGVLAFAVAVSVAAGTIFGLAYAWLMSRVDLIGTLRQEGRGSIGSLGRSRARQILVITELALSLVLMVAAGLLLRGFWDLFKVQRGFNPDRVLAIQTWLPGPNDPTDTYRTATQESVLLREILRRSRTLPGVEQSAVGDVAALPLGHSHGDLEPLLFIREGLNTNGDTKANQAPVIGGSIISLEYFHLLGMPLLRARLFSDQDLEGTSQVAVINRAAARTYWPNQDPLGKRVRLGLSGWSANDGNNDGSTERSAKQVWTDRRRDCGCPPGIVGGRGNSADLPQRVPAPRQRPGHLSSRTTRSQRHLRTSARAGSVHRSRTPRLPCGDPG